MHLIEPINQSTNQSVKVVNIFILKRLITKFMSSFNIYTVKKM